MGENFHPISVALASTAFVTATETGVSSFDGDLTTSVIHVFSFTNEHSSARKGACCYFYPSSVTTRRRRHFKLLLNLRIFLGGMLLRRVSSYRVRHQPREQDI